MSVAPEFVERSKPVARILALWLVIQTGVIALASARVPLSARYPQPAERMAVEQLLVAQLIVASLTFPILLSTRRLAALVMLTAIPMALLANALSEYPLANVVIALGYVELNLLAIALWAGVLKSKRAQLAGIAVGGSLTLLLTMLWYLRLEYQPDAPNLLASLSPLTACLQILHQPPQLWFFWAIPGLFALVAAALSIARRSGPPVE